MKQRPHRAILKSHIGYGLAMLMVFIASTVLIGASLQMLAGPISLAYLGSSSQDSLAARQVAMTGMETVIADIQSRLNSNQTVDTSYTYGSTSVTIPTDPTAPAGATTTVGSYSASMTYARGDSYLVKVTATVGSSTFALSRLINLTRASSNGYILDSVSGATAAYGLRKLRSAYAGSAVRVRRATDNTEQDIGFNGNGELNLVALQSFLSSNAAPLDSVGSAAAAFGLRRLRSAYTGYVIRVRRSSDNTEQDIGFNLDGDLDITALMNFVGSGSGYVKTWYDQSGNAINATQSTTAAQPMIVSSGQLMMVKNHPSIKYDGSDDALRFSRTISDDFTIMATYNTVAGVGGAGAQWYDHASIVDMEVNLSVNDAGISVDTAGNIYAGVGNPDTSIYISSGGYYNDSMPHRVTMTRKKSTGVFGIYTDSGLYTTRGNTNSLTASSAISIGRLQTGANASLNGYISEVIVYGSVLTPANQLSVERNQAQYFSITPVLTATKPLDIMGSSVVAYGLRQLRNSYSGNFIRVRRSSDNTEQDIGMMGGTLDVTSLLSFVGSGSGYVKTWYDQSGNGRNLTQTTNASQPRIVNAGVPETINGKLTVYFDGTDDHLLNASMTGVASGSITAFTVSSTNTGSNVWARYAVLHKTGDADEYSNTTSMQLLSLAGDAYSAQTNMNSINSGMGSNVTPSNLFQSTTWNNGSSVQFYVNGTLQQNNTVSTSLAPDYLVLGAGRGSSTISGYANGTISEFVLYNSAASGTNVVNVGTNQMSYYATNWPMGYITKWYDQSGNGNDAVQTNPLDQPTISYNGDSGVLNRPTVVFSSNYNNTGYGTWLTTSAGMPTSADYSKSAVFSYRPTALSAGLLNNNIISCAAGSAGHAFYMNGSNNLTLFHNGGFVTSASSLTSNVTFAAMGTYTESTKGGVLYLYNSQNATGTAGSSNTNAGINLGGYRDQSFLNGTISEALVFNKVLSSSERSLIYYDQQAYYGAR